MEQGFDPKTILAMLRRRWLVIVAPVFLLMPLVLAVAYILPPSYSATARILVESQQIPSDLARSTVRVDVSERIALIEQRLMTRQNLLELAKRFDVTRGKGALSPSEVVDIMRASTRIQGVRLAGGGGPVTGVNITFTSDRADLSSAVANEFLTLLLEQNIRQRTERATETSGYFREETRRLTEELVALEGRVAQFKIDNEQALPESLPFRREELSRLQQQIFDRELRVLELQEQKQAVIDAVRRGEYDAFGRNLTPEEEELQRLKVTLVQRRSTYADGHPIVRSLEARIAALESRVNQQVARVNPDEILSDAVPEQGLARQVNRILAAIDTQIEKLDQRREDEERRIALLTASIEKTPGVALDLGRMDRQLSALQSQHRETVLKLAQAETGERLEVNQQAERFEVIERAETPPRPTSPNRPVIVAAGFVGTLGVGFGLGLLLEILNRSLRTPADLERQLGVRPIVAIPHIATDREIRRGRWVTRLAVMLLVVVTPATLWVVDQYYQPLPLLLERVAKMTGADRLQALIENRLR